MADDRSLAQKAHGEIAPALAGLSGRVRFGEAWERRVAAHDLRPSP